MRDNPQRVQSVVVAHDLLQALGAASDALSLAALAREVGMTPPRVLRHLGTLVDLGLVERSGAEPQYRLGVGLIRLGERASNQHDLTRLAYPILQKLSDETGQATFLARPQASGAVVWLSLQSRAVPQLTMPPGMTFSLDGSACGRVLLAFGYEGEHQPQFGGEPGDGHPDPLRDAEALQQRLKAVRGRYYDVYGMQDANAVYSLSAPVLDDLDRPVAAIGIVGFSAIFREQRNSMLASLLKAGEQLSRALGSRTPWPPLTPIP
jgi:DNA-binding IclR family transcriptional regulator